MGKTITAASLRKGVKLQHRDYPERKYEIRRKLRGQNVWQIQYAFGPGEREEWPTYGGTGDWTLREIKEQFKIIHSRPGGSK